MTVDRASRDPVGYCRPPTHTRFQPGRSGNPSGRPKGAQSFKSLFQKILKEQISLREGDVTKKISKAEAILRGLVIGAMKGDGRSVQSLLKLAEQTGEFNESNEPLEVQVVRFSWQPPEPDRPAQPPSFPAISQINKE